MQNTTRQNSTWFKSNEFIDVENSNLNGVLHPNFHNDACRNGENLGKDGKQLLLFQSILDCILYYDLVGYTHASDDSFIGLENIAMERTLVALAHRDNFIDAAITYQNQEFKKYKTFGDHR